jgi:hypothetical protein
VKADLLDHTGHHEEAAHLRHRLGNPPGDHERP